MNKDAIRDRQRVPEKKGQPSRAAGDCRAAPQEEESQGYDKSADKYPVLDRAVPHRPRPWLGANGGHGELLVFRVHLI
jgi:hypothetical protein